METIPENGEKEKIEDNNESEQVLYNVKCVLMYLHYKYIQTLITEEKSIEDIVETLAKLKIKSNASKNQIKEDVDLFGEPAMNNAVNICHNIQVETENKIANRVLGFASRFSVGAYLFFQAVSMQN